jgi:excisionase family DNA binding protein
MTIHRRGLMSEEGSGGGMLTPIEAARRLDVPVRRIYELVQDGKLLAYRGERSTIQVRAADVESLEHP